MAVSSMSMEGRIPLPLHAYASTHSKSRRLCEAFAKGAKCAVVPPLPLRVGSVFAYGCLRGLDATLTQARDAGRVWLYADNGYLLTGKNSHFRVTRCAWQHDGSGNAGSDRFDRLRLRIKPWRTSGRHILVCPPEPRATELWGVAADWQQKVVLELKRHTDRPIVVRRRIGDKMVGGAPPLAVALKDCWAVVVWRSNAAVEALLAGVPVLCTDQCAAYRMGTPILGWIEKPVMPDDRQQWAHNLAAAQWSLAEMADGTCWRALNAEESAAA